MAQFYSENILVIWDFGLGSSGDILKLDYHSHFSSKESFNMNEKGLQGGKIFSLLT